MIPDKPHSYLQQNLLALLCHNEEYGKIVANLVDAALYEGDYRLIAERAIEYWRLHNEAPKMHTADLLGDILTDPKNSRAQTFRRILISLLELNESINHTYVLDSIQNFIETQKIKGAILDSANRINANQELAVTEVKEIWYDLLRTREVNFDPGLRLSHYDKVIAYFEQNQNEFKTGVRELDQRYIVPSRGTVFLVLAPAGYGKSWSLVNTGEQALQSRKKVCHISLEMSAEEVIQRYYQRLFAVPKRDVPSNITTFQFENSKLTGFTEIANHPDFAFDSPYVRDELRSRIDWLGTRCDNIVVKRFPGRSLTSNGLRAYLDNLELVEHFIPDMLVLDYIGIMATDPKNHRLHLGRNMEDFRAICVERNMAGVTAHQISREGARSRYSRGTHVAEDWSLIATSDNVVTYSQTQGERRFGLARLLVDKARSEQSGFSILITQSYHSGQFALESVLLESRYEELVEELTKGEREDDVESDDD
jgi:hypothetical protein